MCVTLCAPHRIQVSGVDLSAVYTEGRLVTWWPISSATSQVGVLKNKLFLGDSGIRTMFTITVCNARDVERYSAIGCEKERILLPGSEFEVTGVLPVGHGGYSSPIVRDMPVCTMCCEYCSIPVVRIMSACTMYMYGEDATLFACAV